MDAESVSCPLVVVMLEWGSRCESLRMEEGCRWVLMT